MSNQPEPNIKPLFSIKLKNSWLESFYYVALIGSAGIQVLIATGKIPYKPTIGYSVALVLLIAALANRVLVNMAQFLGDKLGEAYLREMSEEKCDDPTCSCQNTNTPTTSETTDKTYPTNLS